MVESVWLRGRKWFVVGIMTGACVVGLVVAPPTIAVGLALPLGLRGLAATLAVLAFGLLQLAGRGGALPQNRRLVPQTVMARGPVHGPLQFGFELGLGTRTYVTTALPAAALSLVVLLGGGMAAPVLTALGFGFGRVVLIPLRGASSERWDRRLTTSKRLFRSIVLVGFVATAGALVVPAV